MLKDVIKTKDFNDLTKFNTPPDRRLVMREIE